MTRVASRQAGRNEAADGADGADIRVAANTGGHPVWGLATD
jgi:hypothetical protein